MNKPRIKLNSLEKITIKISTKEQAKELMRIFECGGWVWNSGELPTEYDWFWNNQKEECYVEAGISFNSNKIGKFGYTPGESFADYGGGWISMSSEDFYKLQPNVTSEVRKEINTYFDKLIESS